MSKSDVPCGYYYATLLRTYCPWKVSTCIKEASLNHEPIIVEEEETSSLIETDILEESGLSVCSGWKITKLKNNLVDKGNKNILSMEEELLYSQQK